MARPWRRNGGGRPEEGGVAQRLGEGAPCPPPFSRSSPPCPPPGSPPGLPCLGPPPLCPPPPLGCALSLVSARPCPAFPAEGGSRLGGARVLPRLRPRRRSSPGRLGASRDVRRSGGPPWRLPGSGLPRPPGGTSEPRLTWGARRPPPPAASPGRFRPGPSDVRADPALPLRVSPSPPAPSPQASGPGPAPLLPPPPLHLSRALPACAPLPAAAPSPSVARGAWFAGAGRDGEGVGGLVCLGSERGPVRPGGFWGEGNRRRVASGGGGVRWRRPAGLAPSRAGSAGVRALRGWPWPGSASSRWRPVVPSPPASPVPHTLSRYLARPGAEV